MPRKAVSRSNAPKPRAPARRSMRRRTKQDDDVPDVYKEMLAEAYQNNPEEFAPSPRPVKRRKVGLDSSHQSSEPTAIPTSSTATSAASIKAPSPALLPPKSRQVVFNDDFDASDASDLEFEDVDIDRQTSVEPEDNPDEPKSIQLNLSAPSTILRKQLQRKKPVTKAERDFRLDVHKWHLLALLGHLATRNKWCEEESVQKTLKPLVSKKQIARLHHEGTQAERKWAFNQTIEEICQTWRLTWKTTERGMRRAQWREETDMAEEVVTASDPIDLEDFNNAAKECSGSRDLGAQLFCALLRSVAVETRLVCSLQVLPFSRAAKGETPQKATPAYVSAGAQDYGIGQSSSKNKKRIVDSPYPIWWVEVYNPAITHWMPLDPIVRNTIDKPRTGFEPPATDNLNSMAYVIAFEDDGSAKDITRRYTNWYNAKVRKTRVESTKNGMAWWKHAFGHFDRRIPEDRDDIENAALDRRLVAEGMPKNVQDFKDHPVYVLERHLKANQVIEPKREAGKTNVGSGKNAKLESVYRRQDVHSCRSADGWYRRGRDVRVGEQPLKRAIPRNKRSPSMPLDGDDEDESEGVALYAEYQTDLYVPPPVVDGRVPRNGYGNLDVYVWTMIPPGAVHVRHTLAAQAAKVMSIDAAEAVTGFKFKGRQGTAVVDGVIIAAQYTAALSAVTTALEDELEAQVNRERSAIALSVWKKMHAVLRIRQRVNDEYGETSKGGTTTRHAAENDDKDSDDDNDPTYEDEIDINDSGGFVPEVVGEATKESRAEELANLTILRERQPIVLPAAVVRQAVRVTTSPHKLAQAVQSTNEYADDELFGSEPGEAGGYLPDAYGNGGGGFMRDAKPSLPTESVGGFIPGDGGQGGGFVPERDDQAGGFVPDDDGDDQAGGFVAEESDAAGVVAAAEPQTDRNGTALSSSGSAIDGEAAIRLKDTSQKAQRVNGHGVMETRKLTTTKAQKAQEPADDSLSEASLPSHDPDEDDADPQWLEDAFEDDTS